MAADARQVRMISIRHLAVNLLFIAFSILSCSYAILRLRTVPDLHFFDFVFIGGAIGIAVISALTVSLPHLIKKTIALVTVLVTVALAIFMTLLIPAIKNTTSPMIREATRAFWPSIETPVSVDHVRHHRVDRSANEVVAALRESGFEAFGSHSNLPLIEIADRKEIPLLPVGGISHMTTINCSQGAHSRFPVITSDRYGFNNRDDVFDRESDRIVLIGGSLVYGLCVPQEQTIAGHLRRRGYAGISLAGNGNGLLFNLAVLREYGPGLSPSTVVWFYSIDDDLAILRGHEVRSELLTKYLNPAFSQRLVERQDDVDRVLRKIGSNVEMSEIGQMPSEKPAAEGDTDSIRMLGRILRLAKNEVASWGGQIYFAPMPGRTSSLGNSNSPVMDSVIAEVKAAGISIIDMKTEIDANEKLEHFLVPENGSVSHYNALGNSLYADAIMKAALPKKGVEITVATFGGNCRNAQSNNSADRAVREGNATAGVASLCRGMETCSFDTGNSLVGEDPADGCVKDFDMTWMCLPSRKVDRIYVDKNKTGAARIILNCIDGEAGHSVSKRLDADVSTERPATEPAATDVSTPALLTAVPQGKLVETSEIKYESYVGLQNQVSADGVPDVAQTASILGREIVPQNPNSQIRVLLEVPGYAPHNAELVIAIFRAGNPRAVAYKRQPIDAGQTGIAKLEYSFDMAGISKANLDIRVGTGNGGTVFLNGDDKASNKDIPNPHLIIEEYLPQ